MPHSHESRETRKFSLTPHEPRRTGHRSPLSPRVPESQSPTPTLAAASLPRAHTEPPQQPARPILQPALGAAQGRGTNIPREEVRDRLRKAVSLATSRWPAKVVIMETSEILSKKCCDFSQLVNFLSSGSRLWENRTASAPCSWMPSGAVRLRASSSRSGHHYERRWRQSPPERPGPRPAAHAEPEQEEHIEDCIVVRTSLDSGDESDL